MDMNNTEMIKRINEEISSLLDDGEKLQNHSNKNDLYITALTNLLIKEGIITKEKLENEVKKLTD